MTRPSSGQIEVDFEAVDHLLGEGEREARSFRDWAEEDLQIGVGEAERACVEDRAEGSDPWLAGVVLELGAQRSGVNQIQLVCLVHRSLDPDRAEFRRDVDQGDHDSGHRDAVATGDVRFAEAGTRTHSNPRPAQPRATADAHVDSVVALRADSPERRGTAMAQRGVLATRKRGCHPASLRLQSRPTHRVDATHHQVQSASTYAMLDFSRIEPQRQQLPPRHDPMLPPRQLPGLLAPLVVAPIRH